MKYTKKVSVGAFVKKGVDVNNNDIITIANEGKEVEGQYGLQHVFLVKLKGGDEKNLSFNQTSLNGLIDAYGADSIQWIGKKVKVWIIKQNVAGKFTDVLYVSHPEADLTTEGFFMPATKGGSSMVQSKESSTEYPENESEEIPFE